jgi:hypothetical protein
MKYFFILGCHRSGTTLLQMALNRHPAIAVPPETKYFSSFLGHSHRCQVRRLAQINRDLQLAVPVPAGAIRRKAPAHRFYAHIAEEYVKRLGKPNVVYFGEKTPAHTGYVPQIRSTFPEAKLVWLYRDGRDVAASMRNVPWLSQHLGVNMLIWLFYYRCQRRLALDRSAPVVFVKYEDLVTRPVYELERVTDFLGLPFEPQVAQGFGNTDGVRDWEYAWKGRALEPITTARIETWRKELSPADVKLLEAIGADALRTLGYVLVNTRSQRWRTLMDPRLVRDVLRFFRQASWDEAANQLLGRAICLR